MPLKPFQRLCREITYNVVGEPLRWEKEAFEALRTAAEEQLVKYFQDAQLEALHAKRITIKPVDLQITRRVRGPIDGDAGM